jgi:large conductance mechanosensitive channel
MSTGRRDHLGDVRRTGKIQVQDRTEDPACRRQAATAVATGGRTMLQEFKAFAMRGNVVDMAVGIVIGTAFGRIVSSLVNDVIMPPIGRLTGNMDFSDLYVNLSSVRYGSLAAAELAGAPVIKYGLFINSVIDFVIVAFAIFLVVKAMNSLKREEAAAPAPSPEPSNEEKLLAEIRDVLKSGR